jgi:hypothetical protein
LSWGSELNTKTALAAFRESFYESYDVEYWTTRARILHLLIVRKDIRRTVLDALGNFDNDKTIINRLKGDLHFLTFHSVESLFALIFATVKLRECPWIWLTSYKSQEFNDLLHKVAVEGIDSIGVDVRILFYTLPPTKVEDRIQRSCDMIREYLKAIAREFAERGEYNSFKHGLRTMRADTSEITISTAQGKKAWSAEALVTTYLTLQSLRGRGDRRKLRLVAKGIDFERSFRIIEFNTHLMTNLVQIGRAPASKDTHAKLFVLDDEADLSELLRPTMLAGQKQGFTNFTFDYPLIYSPGDRTNK